MTKKKRAHPTVEEVLARPWCFYCERDFDDLKILLNHQKAKHFKCDKCGRRLNTAGGLGVHLSQVHKEQLETVENALPDRAIPNVEIFGMEGIPEEVVQRHNQRVITEYHEGQAERQAATGNPPPGSNPAKKIKIEEPSDLKARLAAFKAKKAASAAGDAGQTSGNGTPTGAGQALQSPGVSNSPAPYPGPAQGLPPPPFAAQGSPPPQFAQPFGQPGYGMPMPPSFSPPQANFPAGPPGFQQLPTPGFPQPPTPGFGQPFPPFGRPPFGMTSPPPGAFNGQQAGLPAPNTNFGRPPGLPAAPGLPSRPSFQTPANNIEPSQQPPQSQNLAIATPTQDPRQRPQSLTNSHVRSANDDIVAKAMQAADGEKPPQAANGTPKPEIKSEDAAAAKPTPDKKGKKEKEKAITLVYDDNEVSPEEKMAKMSRYAFERPHDTNETVLESASGPNGANVTGAVVGEDDVIDTQGD